MPKKIENRDIFSPDFLEPQKKSFRELIALIKSMEKEMKDVLKIQQQAVKNPDKKTTEGLKKRKKAIVSINQVSKEMVKLQKQRKAASAQLALAETKEAKAVVGTRIELARKKKAVKDEILAEKGLVSEYQKQSKKLNDLRHKYKDLILIQGKETKASRAVLKEVTKLDTKLKKVDASVGQFQRSVGNYGKAFGKVSGVLRNFGLAVGGLAIMKNISGIVIQFGQAQADLAAISGKTLEELKPLTEQAKELGAVTQYSATQITQMQIELAKLGFTSQQIVDSTKAISNFAAATGADIPSAAKVAGAALRAFNLEAYEMDRVVSVLGVATTKSALSFQSFETGLSTIAPVAAKFGFSIEDTTALLGQLANAGFDASSAATATRKILLNLADSNGKLAKELGRPIRGVDDLAVAFGELKDKGIDLGEALELTDVRSVAAFSTFIEGSDKLIEFRDSITNVNQELQDMADKRLDSVQGAMTLFGSAWEGLILDMEEGTGVFAALKEVLFFLAENLKTIVKVIALTAQAFLTYKLVIIATTVVTKAYQAATIAFTTVQALLTGGLKKATAAMRLFNMVTKLNPIGLLITVLGAAATALFLFKDRTTEAEKAQKLFNDAMAVGTVEADDLVTKLREVIIEENRIIALQLKRGEITSAEADDLKVKSLIEQKKQYQKLIREQLDGQEELEITYDRLEKASKKLTAEFQKNMATEGWRQRDHLKFMARVGKANSDFSKFIPKFHEQMGEKEGDMKKFEGLLKEAQDKQEEMAADEIAKLIKDEDQKTDAQKAAGEKRAKELQLLLRRLQDLRDEAIKDDEARDKAQINRKYDREVAEIKKRKRLTQVETDLIIALNQKRNKLLLEIEVEYQAKKRAARAEQFNLQAQQQAQQERNTGVNKERSKFLTSEVAQLTKKLKLVDKEIDQGNDSEEQLQKRDDIYNKLVATNDELNKVIFGRLHTSQTERDLAIWIAKNNIKSIKLEIEALKEKAKIEGESQEIKNQISQMQLDVEKNQQIIRNKEFEAQQEILYEKKLTLQDEFNKKLVNGEFESTKKISALRKKLEAETDPKKRAKIEKKLNKQKLKSKEEINADILKAQKELDKALLEQDRMMLIAQRDQFEENSKEWLEFQEKISKIEADIFNIDKELTASDDLAKKKKQDLKDELEALKKFAEKAIEIMDAKTDKQIENIDKEIAASKSREEQLQELAAQGNLTAEQSVGAEIKRQAELERQKEELEKKKVRRQLILQGLELLSSKIDQGDKNPVVGAINDMTILLSALSALPGFIDGTETTVGAALGKPQLNTGTDDYIVRVDGAEKILNPGMSARTGNMTTEEITRAAEMYSNGMFDQDVLIQPKVAHLNQPFQDQTQILKKFDSLESTIRNKPILSDLKFNELTKALIVTVEQNGDLKRTHYKLK